MSDEYYLISPQTYDDQFWWKKDDIEFWKLIFSDNNLKILELGSGTGRLAQPIIKEGLNYTGLEISSKYVSYANLKFPFLNPFVQGDMRNFNLNQKFDVIFIGFNSFLHLLSKKEVVQCFDSIKLHMHSESKLYIDIFTPSPSFLYRSPNISIDIMEFFDSLENSMVNIEEFSDYDESLEKISVIWEYKNKKNICFRRFKFQMKIYYPHVINQLLLENGFKIQHLWGSYDMDVFSELSPLQIYELSI